MHNRPTSLMYGRTPTLARLLEDPSLELKLVAGTPDRVGRVMSGIHLTEILEVERWLAEGWVMMTTGVLLQRKPTAQRTLVRDLHRIGATGLGYCVEVVTKNVPTALLDEARKLNFPLFAMPLHIKARDVATRANRMILANDDTLFQQSLSTQDVFFERFEAAAGTDWLPERQLVENLASLLDLPVTFHSSDTGAAGSDDVIGQALLTAPTHAPITKHAQGTDLLIVPARVGEIFVGWLVVSLPTNFDDGRAAMRTTGAVARLVALAVLSRKRTAANARAVRQELLNQLLGLARRAANPADLLRSLSREGVLSALQDLGFRATDPVRGVLIESEHDATLASVVDAVDALDAPYLFLTHGPTLTIVAQTSVSALGSALDRVGPIDAGIGGEVNGIGQVGLSLEQARAALCSAERAGRSAEKPRLLVYEELPLSSWVLHRDHADSPADKAQRHLAPLRSSPAIFDTVVAYFAQGMDVTRSAETLFIHPNSVRYRLGRAEQMLRVSMQDPAAISDLYLALHAVGEL